MVRVLTLYLYLNTHEAGVWIVMHRVTQTSTTVSCSKIVVRMTWLRLLTRGALLTRAAIDPRSRAEPHVDPGHAHAVWSGRKLSFFLCQHVLITSINCSRYSQPFEGIQNMQMTYSRLSSRCPAAHSLQYSTVLYCTVLVLNFTALLASHALQCQVVGRLPICKGCERKRLCPNRGICLVGLR